MRLSEMRQLLAEEGIQLTKSLGQNFLHDANQLRRIIALADLNADDQVLEIGPGLGPLTELMVETARKVLAIEKDNRLVSVLQRRFRGRKNFDLIHADALEFLCNEKRNWAGWKMVSNLPYSVASPILVELAQASEGPSVIVATLQLEVARRLMAVAGCEDYGILTLLVQLHYQPKEQFKIPASCFFPEPDVDSACIRLIRRASPLLPKNAEPTFNALVKRAFSQRRKMMFKLLKEDWPADKILAAFNKLSLPEQVRAEQVPLEAFAALTKELSRA